MAFHIGQRTIECAVRASPVAYVAEVIGGAGRQTFRKRNVHDRVAFLVGTIPDLARNLSSEPTRRIFRNNVDGAACGVATEQGSHIRRPRRSTPVPYATRLLLSQHANT